MATKKKRINIRLIFTIALLVLAGVIGIVFGFYNQNAKRGGVDKTFAGTCSMEFDVPDSGPSIGVPPPTAVPTPTPELASTQPIRTPVPGQALEWTFSENNNFKGWTSTGLHGADDPNDTFAYNNYICGAVPNMVTTHTVNNGTYAIAVKYNKQGINIYNRTVFTLGSGEKKVTIRAKASGVDTQTSKDGTVTVSVKVPINNTSVVTDVYKSGPYIKATASLISDGQFHDLSLLLRGPLNPFITAERPIYTDSAKVAQGFCIQFWDTKLNSPIEIEKISIGPVQ